MEGCQVLLAILRVSEHTDVSDALSAVCSLLQSFRTDVVVISQLEPNLNIRRVKS